MIAHATKRKPGLREVKQPPKIAHLESDGAGICLSEVQAPKFVGHHAQKT